MNRVLLAHQSLGHLNANMQTSAEWSIELQCNYARLDISTAYQCRHHLYYREDADYLLFSTSLILFGNFFFVSISYFFGVETSLLFLMYFLL